MKTINRLIQEQIKIEKSYYSEHLKIKKMLEPLNGKQFNFKTFSKKVLGNYTLDTSSRMFHIKGKYNHLVGYHSSNSVDSEKFTNTFDTCHSIGAIERIRKLESLDQKELNKIYTKLNKHFKELCFLFGDMELLNLGSFDNPIYYQMLREIQPEPDRKRNIELHEFYYIRERRSLNK